MERVLIHSLLEGQPLEAPLYDAVGNLLLAKGKTLTREMWSALRRAAASYAYVGEWNEAEVDATEPAVPLTDALRIAEREGKTLQAEIDTRLKGAIDTVVEIGDNPFEKNVDQEFQRDRSPERIQEWRSTLDAGVSMIQRIANGSISHDEVAEASMTTVGKVMEAFARDRSLLNHLMTLRNKSEYHAQHALNSSVLSINMASALQYDEKQMMDVGVGALMANLGMSMIPDEILQVERELTDVERLDIQKSIGLGLYTLKHYRGLPLTTSLVVYQHKERADGTGYPKRRKRNVIHEYSQVVSVADVYDAMTSDRPWRKAYHPYKVMEHLIRDANQKFSPKAVRALLKYLSLFPIGSLVKLNTRQIGRVVHTNEDHFDKPIVSVLLDAQGQPLPTPVVKNLLDHENLSIDSVVEKEIDIPFDLGF